MSECATHSRTINQMRQASRFLREEWRWGMLEYSTLTVIPSGMGNRPLYDSMWLLATTWYLIYGTVRFLQRHVGRGAPTDASGRGQRI